MRPAITVAIVVGILIIIILFIFAILFSLHMDAIYNYISETINIFLNNRRRGIPRQRRNAIYVYPQPPRPISEIEMTPIQKNNFVIIENPDSPYTLGIEYLTE